MNADALLTALALPTGSRVDQRVPKKLLLENGAPTAADKRYINEGIDEMLWVAALKPTTIGVPEYRDDSREYLEVAVLRLTLRSTAKTTRLMKLVHRAIPYPVLLLTEQRERGEQPSLSAAHKRWSQGEAGATVLDGALVVGDLGKGQDPNIVQGFVSALSMALQPRANLYALYQGWIDVVVALLAAQVTGTFAMAESPGRAEARRTALLDCAHLEVEMARLRATAAKETQLARQVNLNMELKRAEAAHAAARAKI